ncbi:hypothetical protein REPUB_Repub03eG0195400 [Reevesia pubescens]
MIHGRVTRKTYGDIISKMHNCLSRWENKSLSMVGRLTLVQSVLSVMLGYLMQTTFLPEHVVYEIEKLVRSFLCGELDGSHKLHSINWEKICLPKERGGLNVRDIRKTNLAYLAKLGWKIINDSDSLWVELLEKKYLKAEDFLSVKQKSIYSYTWRSILKGRDVLLKGLGMNVSNGLSTKFWVDCWLPCGPLMSYAQREILEDEPELPVTAYCDDMGRWNLNSLKGVLPEDIIFLVAAKWIKVDSDNDDLVIWKYTSDGNFSVQSAYNL